MPLSINLSNIEIIHFLQKKSSGLLRIEPGTAGYEARMLSIELCCPQFLTNSSLPPLLYACGCSTTEVELTHRNERARVRITSRTCLFSASSQMKVPPLNRCCRELIGTGEIVCFDVKVKLDFSSKNVAFLHLWQVILYMRCLNPSAKLISLHSQSWDPPSAFSYKEVQLINPMSCLVGARVNRCACVLRLGLLGPFIAFS